MKKGNDNGEVCFFSLSFPLLNPLSLIFTLTTLTTLKWGFALLNDVTDSFKSQRTIWKYFPCFFFEFIQLVIFGTEVTDEQLFCSGGFCDVSGLNGRTMVSLRGTIFQVLEISGF